MLENILTLQHRFTDIEFAFLTVALGEHWNVKTQVYKRSVPTMARQNLKSHRGNEIA